MLMKIKMSVCLSLEQAQNKSDGVNMSLSFSPLCRQARALAGKKVLAGGNGTSVSVGRRCLRGSWMAAVHTYSFRSSELNVLFNKDETLTFA